MKFHQNLSIHKPEATAATRATGFTKVAVVKFYTMFENVYNKNKLTSDRKQDCDDKGISCVSKSKSKLITEKEKNRQDPFLQQNEGRL